MPSTGAEKVASFLLTLDRSTAARLLKRLPDVDRQTVTQSLAGMTDVFITRAAQDALHREFRESMLTSEGSALATEDICHLLNEALGPEAETIADQVGSQDRCERARAELERLDDQSLAFVLTGEHRQAVALVLLEVGAEAAAGVLPRLPGDLQQDLVERMIAMKRPAEELITDVLEAAVHKARAVKTTGARGPERNKLKAVATILNRFPEEVQQNLLMNLEANDPVLAQKVREQMFTFEDLMKIGARDVQKLLSGVDTKLLATALKGATPEATIFLLGNVSKRTQDRVREEGETMGAIRLSEVKQAQQEMAAVARDLIQRGDITFSASGEDDLVG